MKLFITGATGFIGTNLIKKLAFEGHDLTINLRYGKKSPFDVNIKTYYLENSDMSTDIKFFEEEKFDGVIHLASYYTTVHKPFEATLIIDSNVRFGSYILECAVNSNVKWFINTGTYWQDSQFDNGSPVNLYAASKQAFESIAKFYIDNDSILFCTIRLSDTFGNGDTRPKVFNLWQKIATSGEKFDMSPGEQLVDISHIDDVVEAFSLLAKHMQANDGSKILNGSVYAVKADRLYSLRRLASTFEEATNRKLNVNWGGKPYRKKEVMVPWQKGIVVPGWKPRVSLIEGIRRMYDI